MRFDLRLPIGLLFSLFGGILAMYGVITPPALYTKSLGINVNLYWGVVLCAFGGLMLSLVVWSRGRTQGKRKGEV